MDIPSFNGNPDALTWINPLLCTMGPQCWCPPVNAKPRCPSYITNFAALVRSWRNGLPRSGSIRWDNLKNIHWDTMGRSTKMGHIKLLKPLASLTPPLGTFAEIQF